VNMDKMSLEQEPINIAQGIDWVGCSHANRDLPLHYLTDRRG